MVKEIKKTSQVTPELEAQAKALGLLLDEIQRQGKNIPDSNLPTVRKPHRQTAKVK